MLKPLRHLLLAALLATAGIAALKANLLGMGR